MRAPRSPLKFVRSVEGIEEIAEIDGDEKACITAMATIMADDKKLFLSCIVKGKTTPVETSQLGSIAPNATDHSESGWQTTDTMLRSIEWLGETARLTLAIPQDASIHVIMDIYRPHTTRSVLELGHPRNIEFHVIPAGYTEQL